MIRPIRALPKTWTPKELEADMDKAIRLFVKTRMESTGDEYRRQLAESRDLVERIFALTGDLSRVDAGSLTEAELIDAARFLDGPPISQDDLRTVSGFNSYSPRRPDSCTAVLGVIDHFLDSARYPWLEEERSPTAAEREAAITATATLRAVERTRTYFRGAEKERQESYTLSRLTEFGMTEVQVLAEPDALAKDHCKRNVIFEGEQCDILGRLSDGRFLAIECKASNSSVNSVKRLNDVSNKAQVWREARGATVVTVAVLSGVFKVGNLKYAQEKGVYLFWEHDLTPLRDFLDAVRQDGE